MKASLLLNLAGPEAMNPADNFDFAPAVLDDNGQVFFPAETIDDPVVLLRKLCDLSSNHIIERTKFFARLQQVDEPI